MKQIRNTNELFSEAKELHQKLDIKHTLVNDFLDYQKKTIETTKSTISLRKCFPTPTRVQRIFQQSFKQLNTHQKVNYYHMAIKHVKKIHHGKKSSAEQVVFQQSEKPAQIFFKLVKRDEWQPAKAVIKKNSLFLKIQQESQISLRDFLIRRSKDTKCQSIILLPLSLKSMEIRIKSDDEHFLQRLRKAWKRAQYERIKDLFQAGLNKSKSFRYHSASNIEVLKPDIKQLNIVTTSLQNFLTKQFFQSLGNHKGFQEQQNRFLIDNKGQRIRKTFLFPRGYSKSLITEMITDRMHNKLRKKNLISIKILKSLPQQQISFYYEAVKVQNLIFEYYFAENQILIDEALYIIQRSFQAREFQYLHKQNAIKGEIGYCIWKLEVKNGRVELLVEAQIKYNEKIAEEKKLEAICEYIGDFECNEDREQEFQRKFQDHFEYLTQDFEDEYLSEFSQNDYMTAFGSYGQNNNPEYSENIINMKKMDEIKPLNLFRIKHPEQVIQKCSPNYFYLDKGHRYLGEDWSLDNEGYLKFLNYQKIKRQRAAIKDMIKKFGRSIFSGHGILNVSMPVQIFAKQSYLQFMCELYKYTPRCLNAAANNPSPIERMKYVFCNKVASQALTKIDKPFNPILGQTYQGTINGCLLYGQQISHHPPISATYFIGPNYRIHTTSQPNFQFGLNKVHFKPSKDWYYVNFDKFNSVVRYDFSQLTILGVVLGERKCCVAGNSYIIDEENGIFVKVMHGKTEKFPSPDAKFADFVHGKLVKLKAGVKTTELDQIKPSDYQEVYGQFHGRMSETLYFDKQPLLNFATQYPYKLEEYQHCLDSDSSKREDLICWRQDNVETAEAAKIRLEEEQRRDRKLRSQFGKK